MAIPIPSDDSLVCYHSVQQGLPVMSIRGALTPASGPLLYDSVAAVMRQGRPELLLDVSAMTTAGAGAGVVFTRIMDEALRWPDVLVLLCAPTDEVALMLTEDMLDPRLVFASLEQGRAAAQIAQAPVSETLLPVSLAGRRARQVVTEACGRWGEAQLIDAATVIADELVSNVAVHAHTLMRLQIQLRRCHLHLAVFDGSPAPAVRLPPGVHGRRGYGLELVDAFSVMWGSTPLPTGKVVWSAIARPVNS